MFQGQLSKEENSRDFKRFLITSCCNSGTGSEEKLNTHRRKKNNLAGVLTLRYSITLKNISEVLSAKCKSNIISEKSTLSSKLLIMA